MIEYLLVAIFGPHVAVAIFFLAVIAAIVVGTIKACEMVINLVEKSDE